VRVEEGSVIAGGFYFNDGSGAVVHGRRRAAITIQVPTSSEDIGLFFTSEAATIKGVEGVCVGTSPSVTVTLRRDTDRSATGTAIVSAQAVTSTTTGDSLTIANSAVPADNFVWLETTATSGTVNDFNLTIEYDID
ncbi:MAG: hypothetical protein ACXABY_18585, partial [Candidatus Thorarchaeota archaeon]